MTFFRQSSCCLPCCNTPRPSGNNNHGFSIPQIVYEIHLKSKESLPNRLDFKHIMLFIIPHTHTPEYTYIYQAERSCVSQTQLFRGGQAAAFEAREQPTEYGAVKVFCHVYDAWYVGRYLCTRLYCTVVVNASVWYSRTHVIQK